MLLTRDSDQFTAMGRVCRWVGRCHRRVFRHRHVRRSTVGMSPHHPVALVLPHRERLRWQSTAVALIAPVGFAAHAAAFVEALGCDPRGLRHLFRSTGGQVSEQRLFPVEIRGIEKANFSGLTVPLGGGEGGVCHPGISENLRTRGSRSQWGEALIRIFILLLVPENVLKLA